MLHSAVAAAMLYESHSWVLLSRMTHKNARVALGRAQGQEDEATVGC